MATVNGAHCSYASIEIAAEDLSLKLIKSISYKSPTDIGEVIGMNSSPVGRTRGQERAEGSLELYNADWKRLLTKLGEGYAEVSLPWKVVYAEEASPEDIMIDTLPAVRVHSPERSHSEGPDALVISVTLSILGPIKWNGYEGLRLTARP